MYDPQLCRFVYSLYAEGLTAEDILVRVLFFDGDQSWGGIRLKDIDKIIDLMNCLFN